jgi:hypothetical protein
MSHSGLPYARSVMTHLDQCLLDPLGIEHIPKRAEDRQRGNILFARPIWLATGHQQVTVRKEELGLGVGEGICRASQRAPSSAVSTSGY